jgi:hypothetical protein
MTQRPFYSTLFFVQILYGVFILLSTNTLKAQILLKNAWKLEIAPQRGYHFASNPIAKTGANMSGYATGLEMNWVQEGLPEGSWRSNYGTPYLGLSARLTQLNNVDTFGYSLAIFPFYTLPLFCGEKNYVGVKIGYGINLNNTVYHRQNNFDNRAISSLVNFSLDFGLKYYHHFNNSHSLSIGTGLYHVSNGSLKKPNGGLNVLSMQMGYLFSINNKQTQRKRSQTQYGLDFKRNWEYRIYAAAAYRQMGEVDNIVDFPVFGINQQWLRNINRLYATGLALDTWFDPTQAIKTAGNPYRVSSVQTEKKILFSLGWYNKFKIGKIFLPLSLHHYLQTSVRIIDPVYIKFGAGYETKKRLFIGLFFKGTINGKSQLESDFMEWAMGFKF